MEAVKLGPDFQIGETFTYHHGVYKMTLLYPGDLGKAPVRVGRHRR